MKHVRFEPTVPFIIHPKRRGNSAEEIYETPAADFQLSRIVLSPRQSVIIESTSPDIYFVYEGKIEVYEGDDRVACRKGGALLALAGSKLQVKAGDEALVFRASVPIA
jgi:mannose-6-phosphate isomerase